MTGRPPTYGMKTRGFPGTLAPMYHELAVGKRVALANSLTWSTQASSASMFGLDGFEPAGTHER